MERKGTTNKWVIRTSYSNNTADNNCPKVSASQQQNVRSNSPFVSAHPVSTDLSSRASNSKGSGRWVPPEALQMDDSNRHRMSTEPKDVSSRKVGTVGKSHNPSVYPPSMSWREPFVQGNQRSGYWKKSDNENNQPAVARPKISVYGGEPAIYFDESVINASAEKFKYCLVGKFPYSWPSLAQIRVWAAKEWKLEGKWSITVLGLHCVFIRLDNEIDLIRIWVRNRWWINGHLMRVFKWTPEFHLENQEPSSAAVWIALPVLPLVFFQDDVLFSIASLLGKALVIDDETRTLSRTDFARVCIEVDLLVEIPHRVWIGIGGQGFWQDVHYGKLPSYCTHCNQQGHSTMICKFKTSRLETNHPIKKVSCSVVEPCTGCDVASETLTEYKAHHHPNNAESECISIENPTKPQVDMYHSNECRSDMNSPVKSQHSENLTYHSSAGKVIKTDSVDLKFSGDWLSDSCSHEPLENESSQAKQIQICPVQDKEKNNQPIILAPPQLQSVGFIDAESIPKILTRTEETEILNVAVNHASNKENCEIQEVEEGNKSVSQKLVHDEPFCNPCFAAIEQTDANVLQRMHTEIDKPEECREEVDSQVKAPTFQILRGQQSNEMIRASSVDVRSSVDLARDWDSQDQFLKSNSFVQNYVEGESSQAKSSQKHCAIRNKGSSSQPIIMTSPRLSPKRVTLVEALDKSLANREHMEMGYNKGKQKFGMTFSTYSIMNETFIRISEANNHMEPSGKKAMDKLHKTDLLVKGKTVPGKELSMKIQGNQNPPTRMRFSSKNPILFWTKNRKNDHTTETYSKDDGSFNLKRYKYSVIETMTMSFRDKIGKGGSGSVFKGVLPDSFAVAVKVLDQKTYGAEEQFRNELASMQKIDHVNIISLLGFCSEGSRRALVYEFMPNGSLDNFIFSTESTGTYPLGQERLYNIAVGIARGLDYLHNWCSPCILHLDIKPSNILLDQDFCPKICDFGLAQLLSTAEETHLTTNVRGTHGDLAPEFLMKCRGTHKLDVYSYGVTLLEIVSGRKNRGGCHGMNLPDLIFKCLVQGDVGVNGFTGVADEETARKMALVGLWCTQWEPHNRPSMKRVLEMLEGNIEDLQMPPEPRCLNAKDFEAEDSGDTSKNNNYKGRSPCSGSGLSSIVNDPVRKFLPEMKFRIFTFAELKSATRNFGTDTIIGEGGFGPVYKGWIDGKTLNSGRSGSSLPIFLEKPLRILLERGKESPEKRDKGGNSLVIAVKILSARSKQGFHEYQSEVDILGKLSHPNLVKLLGYCWQKKHPLLVYEYMPNGSLDNHIFRRKNNLHLNWSTRYHILLGIARALDYLHESGPRIVHRDVKASNILLDADLKPKLSDFGLAKLYDDEETHISTRVAGTIGYMAPEYAMRGYLTEKADVYAFGVVAFEVLSGRSNTDSSFDDERIYLLEWAWHLHENNRPLELVDPTLSNFNEEEAIRAIEIGFLCTQQAPVRPSMSQVVAMLSGDIEVSNVKAGSRIWLPQSITGSFSEDGSRESMGRSTSSHGNTPLDASL